MYGGMLYFPLKVNLFEEIAVELVEAKFGLKGTAAVMKLLCKIHKENGYYHPAASCLWSGRPHQWPRSLRGAARFAILPAGSSPGR